MGVKDLFVCMYIGGGLGHEQAQIRQAYLQLNLHLLFQTWTKLLTCAFRI